MDLRMHYLLLFKSAAMRTCRSIPSGRIIGREMAEWVLFRRYRDGAVGLESLADSLGIPREEVASFLWTCSGERFLTVRKRLRVADARELLVARPDLSFAQIARAVGFPDKSDFRKAFKEETGFLPRTWRESGGNRMKCRIREIRERGRSRCHAPRTSA